MDAKSSSTLLLQQQALLIPKANLEVAVHNYLLQEEYRRRLSAKLAAAVASENLRTNSFLMGLQLSLQNGGPADAVVRGSPVKRTEAPSQRTLADISTAECLLQVKSQPKTKAPTKEDVLAAKATPSESLKIMEEFSNPRNKGYKDASIVPDLIAFKAAASRKRGGGASEPFPQKLHRMLEDLERQPGGVQVASFLPHGRAFVIHNPKKFVEVVMPKYFRMSRFASFQRQLNLYDFERVGDGRDKGAYYHELFLRGRPMLCLQMRRTKIKGDNAHVSRCTGPIDFYKMPPVNPR